MKYLLLGILLSCSLFASAVHQHSNSKPLTELQLLGTRLCMLYTDSRDIPKDATQIMVNYLTENTSIKPTTVNIIKFINQNQDEMDCSDDRGIRRNFVKMAIKGRHHGSMISAYLMDTLLPEDEETMLDYNAVDIINGKPETILDYLDAVLDGSAGLKVTENMRKDFNNLRFTLIDVDDGFGAKHFKDLPKAVQAKYLH